MYKQLFTQSNLSPKEINQRLGIVNIQRERLEVANKINIERFVNDGLKLGLSKSKIYQVIFCYLESI